MMQVFGILPILAMARASAMPAFQPSLIVTHHNGSHCHALQQTQYDDQSPVLLGMDKPVIVALSPCKACKPI